MVSETHMPEAGGPGTGGMRRAAIIGAGAVGATAAYAMVQSGAVDEILLVDRERRRAEGEVMDLQHCVPFSHPVALEVRALDEVEGCDLIVITAGAAQKEGESRLDLVQRNAAIVRSIMEPLVGNNKRAFYMLVTNPVDVMTRVALTVSGMPPAQVFGTGTVLDTARFRALVSRHCRIHSRHVHANVVGEHGDSEVLVWSRASIGPFSLHEFCSRQGLGCTEKDKERISRDVREAAYQIIERKGSTHFAIGLATLRLTEALSSPQNSVFTVSRRCEGVFGLEGVCLSVPTMLSRSGAHTPIELDLSSREHDALMRSAEVLEEVYAKTGVA